MLLDQIAGWHACYIINELVFIVPLKNSSMCKQTRANATPAVFFNVEKESGHRTFPAVLDNP